MMLKRNKKTKYIKQLQETKKQQEKWDKKVRRYESMQGTKMKDWNETV
jgi:hypothetical protein